MELEVLKLKPLLGIALDDKEQDFALNFLLDNVKETILNYCNLKTLPTGLENTAYRMAIDTYRNEQVGKSEMDNRVSSIEEGDTKVSFNSNNFDSTYTSSLLKNYQYQLNRYRRIAW